MAGRIKVSEGSIGYVEYHFAKRLGLPDGALRTGPAASSPRAKRAGRRPWPAIVKQMPRNLRLFLPDPEGEDAYPIVTYSWLLLYDRYQDREKGAAR